MSDYKLDDLLANIRTYIPDFDMATEIMKRLRSPQAQVDTNTSEALEALDRLAKIAMDLMLYDTIDVKFNAEAYRTICQALTQSAKKDARIEELENHVELIDGELTAAYIAGVESMRGKMRPVVDVEALKKPNLKAVDHGYKATYNKGWNECLDYLKERGLI